MQFALGGNPARAREFMQRYERAVTDLGPRTRARALRFMGGQIALAERRWPEATLELKTWQDSASTLDLAWVASGRE